MIALKKDRQSAQIGSLKVALKFLKGRRRDERNDIDKKRYDQEVTKIQAQLAKLQRRPKRPNPAERPNRPE